MLVMATLLVVPMVVRANANEDDTPTETPVVQEITEETVEEVEEEPVVEETPVVEEPEVIEEEPIEEEPETVVDEDGVTLGEAQIIAVAEHPDSMIVKTKIGTFEGNAVYVFKFEDGWKVSVRAVDGVVVEVKDPSEKKHDCQNKKWDDEAFRAWIESRKAQRRGDNDGQVRGASDFKKHNGWKKHKHSHNGRHNHHND